MHRASSPGPTVPRKHHKGENPHETSPVIGAALRYDVTTDRGVDLRRAGADARRQPLSSAPAAPTSFAARVRRDFADVLELQISGERLRDQGDGVPDAWQASASAYLWALMGEMRLDALLDWGLDRPDVGPTAQGVLAEAAVRSADRRAGRLGAPRDEPARGAARRARSRSARRGCSGRPGANTSAGDRALRACSSASSRRRPTRTFPTRWRRRTGARRRSR